MLHGTNALQASKELSEDAQVELAMQQSLLDKFAAASRQLHTQKVPSSDKPDFRLAAVFGQRPQPGLPAAGPSLPSDSDAAGATAVGGVAVPSDFYHDAMMTQIDPGSLGAEERALFLMYALDQVPKGFEWPVLEKLTKQEVQQVQRHQCVTCLFLCCAARLQDLQSYCTFVLHQNLNYRLTAVFCTCFPTLAVNCAGDTMSVLV